MEGQQIGDDLTIWPDCLSIDLDVFPSTLPGLNVFIYQENVLRPDMFIYKRLGTNNLEDIVLWLNEIASRRDLQAGMSLLLPVVQDINSYFIENRQLN
jgi:hypothetical protein